MCRWPRQTTRMVISTKRHRLKQTVLPRQKSARQHKLGLTTRLIRDMHKTKQSLETASEKPPPVQETACSFPSSLQTLDRANDAATLLCVPRPPNVTAQAAASHLYDRHVEIHSSYEPVWFYRKRHSREECVSAYSQSLVNGCTSIIQGPWQTDSIIVQGSPLLATG